MSANILQFLTTTMYGNIKGNLSLTTLSNHAIIYP